MPYSPFKERACGGTLTDESQNKGRIGYEAASAEREKDGLLPRSLPLFQEIQH